MYIYTEETVIRFFPTCNGLLEMYYLCNIKQKQTITKLKTEKLWTTK